MDPLLALTPGAVGQPGFGLSGAFGVPMYSGNGAVNRLDPLTGGLTPLPTMTGASTDPMVQMLMLQSQMLTMMMSMLLRLMMNRGQQQAGGGAPNSLISDGSGGLSGVGGAGGAGGASALGGSGGATDGSGPVGQGTQAMLQKARSMVGLHESRDRDKIKEITGKSGIDPATTPWCAAFAINMMKEAGTLDTTGLKNPNYCPEIESWAKGKGIWMEKGSTPKAGDAILFDWQGDGTADHIGLVEKVEGGKIYTIEGNSSDSVKQNSYAIGDGKIKGFVKSNGK